MKKEKVGKHYIDITGETFCDLCLAHEAHVCGILGFHFTKKDLTKWNGKLFTKKGAYTKQAKKEFIIN